jgi:hypothetical protein
LYFDVFLYRFINGKYRVLLGLGSSKPWEDILEEFAGVRTFSAKSCLKYFQPLREYLEGLVETDQLTVGWTCHKNSCSKREIIRTNIYLFLVIKFIFSTVFSHL